MSEFLSNADFRTASIDILDEAAALGLKDAYLIEIDAALPHGWPYVAHDSLNKALVSRVRGGTQNFNRLQIDALRMMLTDMRLIAGRHRGAPLDWGNTRWAVETIKSINQVHGTRGADPSRSWPTTDDWSIFQRVCMGANLKDLATELGITMSTLTVQMDLLYRKFDMALVEIHRANEGAKNLRESATLENEGRSAGVSSRDQKDLH